MTPQDMLHAQALNNAVANHRLLAACARLDAGAIAAPRTGFFPSIIATLNHNLTVDRFYVSALEGDCIGYAAFEPRIPCPRLDNLAREQDALDRRLVDVSRHPDVSRAVTLRRPAGARIERADRVLLHLFQHQIHHRGQAHAMLSGTDVPPPQLDEFFLDEDGSAADLAALGLDADRQAG